MYPDNLVGIIVTLNFDVNTSVSFNTKYVHFQESYWETVNVSIFLSCFALITIIHGGFWRVVARRNFVQEH